jgi:hypothetical protein
MTFSGKTTYKSERLLITIGMKIRNPGSGTAGGTSKHVKPDISTLSQFHLVFTDVSRQVIGKCF